MMRILIIIYLCLLSCAITAQNNVWIRTGITDTVISVTENAGNIWVATQNAGIQVLNPFTGEITDYNTQNLQVGTNDFRIIHAFNNKIYAGSFSGGLYIYDNNIWSWIDTSNSPLPSSNVTDIAYDSLDAILWIATDKGLARVQNNVWQIMDSINSPLRSTYIKCLLLDENNILWIGTKYGGVTKLEADVYTNYHFDNSGLNSNLIRTIISDGKGILYIADYLGVDKFEVETEIWLFVYNTFTSQLTHNSVNRLAIDDEGYIWFVTHNGITKSTDDGAWDQYFTTNSNIPANTADGLWIDENRNVWAGTYGGLAILNSSGFTFPQQKGQLLIYPNPARNTIHLNLNVTPDLAIEITIYDVFGQMILMKTPDVYYFGETDYALDISKLNKGMYFVQAKTNAEVLSGSFIIN